MIAGDDDLQKKHIVNPTLPYDYCRTYSALKRLVCRYRGLIRFAESGTSQMCRNIPTVVLGSGGKKILAVGAIHGREYVTTGYLLRCIEEYAENVSLGNNLKSYDLIEILREYSFYFVPMANPDSVEIALGRDRPLKTHEGFCAYEYKNNARGVNLNANFPFMWEEVPKERSGGTAPACERETAFLINICRKHKFLKAFSFHARGGCVYWRDAGNGAVQGDCETVQKLSVRCGFRVCPVTESVKDYSGGFENWFRSEFRKPAFCVELVNDENAPFDKCCSEFYTYTDFERTKTAILCSV